MNSLRLNELIEEFRITFLGELWQWRKGQKEAIIEIINAYNNGIKTVIVDAPVGSGKSILAMCASWIFNKIDKKCYILASDISLQEQYEKDFKKFNLNWGSIKGIDNYLCIDNNEKNSLGTCRIRNIQARKMSCYNECPYYYARDIASKTSTSLLNYAYWLISQNYVNQHLDEPIFPPRQVTFCDEGHKILDIIQNHYSPRFDKKTIEKLEKLTEFFAVFKVKDHIRDFSDIKSNIGKLYRTDNQDTLHEILLEIELSFEEYFPSVERLKKKVEEDYPHDNPPREWKEALRNCDWLKDLHCKVEDYNDIIEKTSTRNIIKNPTGEDELTFNCLEESYMMHKYFHQWTGFTVLMSATFADPSKYLRSIALNTAKYIKMDSNFSFEKSPIYFYNRRRMTYNQIEANLPWLYKKIDEILENHKHESGIIHTASYDLAMKIYEHIPKRHRRRILVYNGTEEKRQVLDMLKVNKDKVLLGPSLLEGLDLKDDWSRFAIFAKVPYLSLSDKFVATKLKINPEWYREKAILNILQGTGRSVRSETDWAVTYILDGALADLIHNSRKSFPSEFLNRIIIAE
jgi:ATP-dependent DNA helicase DinG